MGFLYKKFLCIFLWFSKGLYGLYWHYSPWDRVEVAMYWRRSLVGLQQCKVSPQDEERESRVLWAPTHQHKPCFEFSNLRNGRTEVLEFIAPKWHLLWCCDRHLLLEKSTFSLVRFNDEPVVQTWMGVNVWICLRVKIGCLSISFILSMITFMCYKLRNGFPIVESRRNFRIFIEIQICWEISPQDSNPM